VRKKRIKIKKNIIFVVLLFCLLIKSRACICNVNIDTPRNQSVIKPVISATKYISLFLCIVYGVEGIKKGASTTRLLLPSAQEGQNLQITDIIKFPFRLVLEFPCGAFDTMKYFMLSGGFGGYAYITYKLGF